MQREKRHTTFLPVSFLSPRTSSASTPRTDADEWGCLVKFVISGVGPTAQKASRPLPFSRTRFFGERPHKPSQRQGARRGTGAAQQ